MFFSGISDEAGSSIAKQIAAHKELGWDSLELRLIDGTNLTLIDDAAFEKVFEAVTAAGMTVCCFASALGNWSRPVRGDFELDINELKTAIPRMQRFGTKYIRIMSWVQGEASDDEWRDEAVKRLKVMAQLAADGGIVLLHENCTGWGGESPEHSLELLERVGNPALKLMYDTGNVFAHRQDPIDFVTKVMDHVLHVHIKDGKLGDEGKSVYAYPGEGACRVSNVIRLFFENGYDGGFSIEPHLAAIVHTGDLGGEAREQAMWQSYLEYGRRMMALVNQAKAEAKVKV
ncbi:MAG: sugar phosphate isomerase/epimerase family protein [Armatimonadota bacterium]